MAAAIIYLTVILVIDLYQREPPEPKSHPVANRCFGFSMGI